MDAYSAITRQTKKEDHKRKDWYWCNNHSKWCRHTSEQCKGLGNTTKNFQKKFPSKQGSPRLAQAKQATARFTDDSSEEE